MSTITGWEVLAEAAAGLRPEDRLRLVERIVHDLATNAEPVQAERPLWRDVRGIVEGVLAITDAQDWVSTLRREAQSARDAVSGISQ